MRGGAFRVCGKGELWCEEFKSYLGVAFPDDGSRSVSLQFDTRTVENDPCCVGCRDLPG
ncbi:hypothetical protein MPNT_160034 [Candidatus Methylacidithermus pantelleriae]|uniref:Uncharacterized protein n=1 Tax=Candidatus Methylacidithermus pantelleriae TaxID=2744239 RepID=A0A8J2BS67_9BACT|nr:hypothetical protein MPNT_160034 [Candidatus Methylacidithermus pantelleriae]